MRLFVASAERGSLAAAARASGLSLATVSRSIAGLERALGARLLARTTRSLSLTPGGREYYARARRILDELAEADATLARESAELAGRLTVSGPTLFGRHYLAPAVSVFLRRHPKLEIHLVLTDRYLDLVEEGIDLAVRTGRLADSSLIARRVGAYRRIVAAAPAYLRRAGTPKRLSDLQSHACLVLTTQRAPRDWQFVSPRGTTSIEVSGNWQTNDSDALLAAALAGHGLARLPSWQAGPHLAAGRLVRVLADHPMPEIPVQIVFPSARLLAARVRAFAEFLREEWKSEDFGEAESRAPRRKRRAKRSGASNG